MDGLRKITPYVAGEQPAVKDAIKLNTNENAFPPSPEVFKVIESFNARELTRYPSLTNSEMIATLSEQYHLPNDYFLVGNGSDEILAFAFQAFFNSERPLLFPDITYGFYKIWADLFHIPYKEIPLAKDFTINCKDYQQDNGGIIFPNPNAPTGIYKTLDEIELLLQTNKNNVVIIDEAYIDFGGESVVPLIEKYDNLVVIKTFSKSRSLAGIRLGYAISNPRLISVLSAIKHSFNPYSVDMITDKIGTAAVKDADYYRSINDTICHTRDVFSKKLTELGFTVLPSKTNFVFATHSDYTADEISVFLKTHSIFVRHFSSPERINNFLRISIGTEEEMKKVIEKLTIFLQ